MSETDFPLVSGCNSLLGTSEMIDFTVLDSVKVMCSVMVKVDVSRG